MQARGFKVFRYTGTEIIKTPFFIASEIIGFVCGRDQQELQSVIDEYLD